MRKHRGTPCWHDKYVTLAAISPPGVARGSFVGGGQSGLAGCKSPPLFKRGASSCSSQPQRQGEPWGAPPRPSAPTYLPTYLLGGLGAGGPRGGGHNGGAKEREGCGGRLRSSRPRCGVGLGCWGGRGASPVAMAMVHAWSVWSAM